MQIQFIYKWGHREHMFIPMEESVCYTNYFSIEVIYNFSVL